MHPYARHLKALFTRNANPKLAPAMEHYMRDQFEYLGIKSPRLAELLREHTREHGLPPPADLDRIVRDLWALPAREFHYAATSLLGKLETRLPAASIRTMEYMMVTKSWWDTVDSVCTGTLAVHFKRYPKVREKYLAKWRKSKEFWLRRATILFQLNYKQDTDFDLLCEIICENLGSREFFINKAIGWALRQYSRVDAPAVRRFVAETPLHPLSRREALKWLARRGL